MRTYIAFAVGIALYILIQLLPKTNTRVGAMLRRSDHTAWQYAVEDKERELLELRGVEPREDLNDKRS